MDKKDALIFGILILSFFVLARYLQRPSLPDFSAIKDIQTRKQAFFQYLSPLMDAENKKILNQRKEMMSLHRKTADGIKLSRAEKQWLYLLADNYDTAAENTDSPIPWQILKKRVDVIPKPLALIQAAVESAWGTSRFARQANNFFGEHCNEPGCGILPEKRSENAAFEVKIFHSARESVQSYIHNLNTHNAYASFRLLRQEFRRKGKPLDAGALAGTLHAYSDKKHTYIRKIQSMIVQNRQLISKLGSGQN